MLSHRPRLLGSVESILTTLNLSLGPCVAPGEVAVVDTYLAANLRVSQCTAIGALGGWNGRGGDDPSDEGPGWKYSGGWSTREEERRAEAVSLPPPPTEGADGRRPAAAAEVDCCCAGGGA